MQIFGLTIKFYSYPAVALFVSALITIFYTHSKIKKAKIKNSLVLSTKDNFNLLLYLFLISAMVFAVCDFLTLSAPNADFSLRITRIYYGFAFWQSAIMFHLISSYPKKRIKNPFIIYLTFYFPATIGSMLAFFTPLIIESVKIYPWGYGKVTGTGYFIFRALILWLSIVGFLNNIKNFIAYRSVSSIRNIIRHLFLAALIPILHTVILVGILPIFFNTWLCHVATPSYALMISIFYISYIIMHQNLLDIESLVGPLFKTEKYIFHQNLRKFIYNLNNGDSIKIIIKNLSYLIECNVFLYFNLSGEEFYISSEKNNRFLSFTKYRINEVDIKNLSPGNQKLTSFLSDCQAEHFFTIIDPKITGLIVFGKNFSNKCHSTQDMRLLNDLCEEIKKVILLQKDKSKSSPLYILKKGNQIKGVISDHYAQVKIIDMDKEGEQEVPVLKMNAYYEFTEKIITDRQTSNRIENQEVPFTIGDILLLHLDNEPFVFMKIEKIEQLLETDQTFSIQLLILKMPPEIVIWNLSEAHLNGVPFVMDNQKLRLTKLISESKKMSKVVPFKRPISGASILKKTKD